MKVLLIYPPVSKPCEPPAGIARLAGALREHDVPCTVIDANIEGLHFLLHSQVDWSQSDRSQGDREGPEIRGDDPRGLKIGGASPELTAAGKVPGRDRAGYTWTRRALRNLTGHLLSLRSGSLYEQADRYRRAVADLNRIVAGASFRVSVRLADYHDEALSPRRSADLLQSAAQPDRNPFYHYFRARIVSLLERQNHEIIGISVNYLSQALCAFALIGLIRPLAPRSKIILGGGLVTSWQSQSPRQNMSSGGGAGGITARRVDSVNPPGGNNPFPGLVDELVAGPGEDYLLSLIEKYREDRVAAASPVMAALSGPPLPVVPCPDYGPFSWDLYMAPGAIVPYSASTGCYWRRCRFCPETAEGNPYRPLPVRKVFADLERLKKETSPVLIHFLDNALSPALLRAVAVQGIGVPWYGFVRITEQLADPSFCRRLHDAGCVMLKLGLESGDQAVLDALEKGIDLKTASRVLRNLKEAHIGTYVYFLFGTPAEDRSAACRTMDYIAENSPYIDFLNVAIFNLPAFAAATAELVTRPFSTGDLSLYRDFDHPGGWNRREVRRFVVGQLKKNPVVAGIIKQTPPVFTSNHAPFLI
jgi:radical SAM superfamily enzyme YgiQ (UPF0313 family)